jgi:hypothetical protein
MAYPTSLDNFTNPQATDKRNNPSLAGTITTAQDAIEALEAKVGVDSSAVATSLDYLVKSASSSNPGHKHTLAQGATDVTATAAELNTLDGFTGAVADLNKVDGLTGGIVDIGGAQTITGAKTLSGVTALDGGWSSSGQPRCRLKNSADHVLATGASTALGFDTEVFDTGGMHDTGTNTERITFPSSGLYLISGQVAFDPSSGGSYRIAMIRLNNASIYSQNFQSGSFSASRILCVPVSGLIEASAGDYIQLNAQQDTGGNLNTDSAQANTWLEAVKLA